MKTKTYCICEVCDGEIRDTAPLQYKSINIKEEGCVAAIGKETIDLRVAFKIKAGAYHVGCLISSLFNEPIKTTR